MRRPCLVSAGVILLQLFLGTHRLGKHVPAATNTQAKLQEISGAWSPVQRVSYKREVHSLFPH
jgi:hypothetical protein